LVALVRALLMSLTEIPLRRSRWRGAVHHHGPGRLDRPAGRSERQLRRPRIV